MTFKIKRIKLLRSHQQQSDNGTIEMPINLTSLLPMEALYELMNQVNSEIMSKTLKSQYGWHEVHYRGDHSVAEMITWCDHNCQRGYHVCHGYHVCYNTVLLESGLDAMLVQLTWG